MRSNFRFALPLLLIAAASCSQTSPKPAAPAPAQGAGSAAKPAAPTTSAPAPAAAAPAGRGGAPGAGGPPGGGRGGPPMTPEQRAARRDSIGVLRLAQRTQVLKDIAGHENEPAGTVFKNVQILKDMPAGKFVAMMDSVYGKALGRNCTDCHVANRWDSDSLGRKKTARIMASIVEGINGEQLTKIPLRAGAAPGSTPKINCITCHRGNPGGPNQALLP